MPADTPTSLPRTRSARHNPHASSACVSCRAKKTKCNGVRPTCDACIRLGRLCEWAVEHDRRTAPGRACKQCPTLLEDNARLHAKVAALEAQLRSRDAETVSTLTVVVWLVDELATQFAIGSAEEAQPHIESLPCSPGSVLPLVDTSTTQPLFAQPEVGHVVTGANLNFGPPALGNWGRPKSSLPMQQTFYTLQGFPDFQFPHNDPPLFTGDVDAAYAQLEATYLTDELDEP